MSNDVIPPVRSTCQPTLPVVAHQPRSVQVATPVSTVIIRPPVHSVSQPTLPVVAPQPQSAQVIAHVIIVSCFCIYFTCSPKQVY